MGVILGRYSIHNLCTKITWTSLAKNELRVDFSQKFSMQVNFGMFIFNLNHKNGHYVNPPFFPQKMLNTKTRIF